jgi:hypothetical protein
VHTVTSICRMSAALLVTLVAGVGLAGCGSGGQSASPSGGQSPSSTSSGPKPLSLPAEPPSGYDISRIAQLANAFPPDFKVTPIGPITLTQEQADRAMGAMKKLGSTYNPPECDQLLKHPITLAGSKMQGFAARGSQEIMVAAAQSAQPVPTFMPVDACKHVTFDEPGKVKGTVDHLPSPPIDGLTVIVLKVHVEVTEAGTSKTLDQYQYQAPLSDRTGVVVMGSADPQLLEGLLTKAVTAIRGH